MTFAATGRWIAQTGLLLVTLFLLVGTLGTTTTASASTVSTKSVAEVDSYERKVQYWVNRQRVQRDLPRLTLADCPDSTAAVWSGHLASTGEFYHQSMTDVLDRCDATYAGETLGRGGMTPRGLVRLWMQSPPHRAVLLSAKPRRIGIGATYDTTGRWVVAANFVRF
jgi:uncharacterized protein YkwD